MKAEFTNTTEQEMMTEVSEPTVDKVEKVLKRVDVVTITKEKNFSIDLTKSIKGKKETTNVSDIIDATLTTFTQSKMTTKRPELTNHTKMPFDEKIPYAGKCCKVLKMMSTNATSDLYPFLVGTYIVQSGKTAVYKMKDQKRFISRPPSKGLTKFSWGVNSNPKAKWGWLKAFSDGDCPDDIVNWRAYDGQKKQWVKDWSLSFNCV